VNAYVQAKERMMKMVRKIVEERMKKINDNNAEDHCAVNDVVDALLRDKSELYNSSSSSSLVVEMISQNIIEFMIPGEETLPTAMTLALKFLSDSPLALSKLMVCS
jgi:3-epi-6-deoxocathasterone 23-monooxygenase